MPTPISPASGAAKRVVFFDTLLTKLSPTEVEAVLAHELGHFKHRHMPKRIVAMFALSLARLRAAGLAVAARSGSTPGWACSPNMARAQRRAGAAAVHARGAGVRLLRDAAVRRRCRAGTSSRPTPTPARRPAAATWPPRCSSCYEDNASTLTPDPLYVRFYYSHPPASERLAAMGAPASSSLRPSRMKLPSSAASRARASRADRRRRSRYHLHADQRLGGAATATSRRPTAS